MLGPGGLRLGGHVVRFAFMIWLSIGASLSSSLSAAVTSNQDHEIFLTQCPTVDCSSVARREQVILYDPKTPPQSLTLLLPYDGLSAQLSIQSLQQIDLQSLLLNYDLFPQVVQIAGVKYFAISIKAPRELANVSLLNTAYKLTFTWLKPDEKDGVVDSALAMQMGSAAGAGRGGDPRAAIAYVQFREAVIIGNSAQKSQSAEVAAKTSCSGNTIQVPNQGSIFMHFLMLCALIALGACLRSSRVGRSSQK